MVKKSLQWVYRAALWLVGSILVILIITAAGVHFLLMPNINDYKENIAAFASRSTNQKIAIGNINADWQGINPHFIVTNIDVFDAQNRPALQLNNTEVTLSWLSIPKLEPHLATLVIRNPALTIRRMPDGEIFIAGISTRGESKPDAMNWLLRQSQLSVINAKVTWLDEQRQAPALSLNQLNLEIISPPWKRFIKNHEVSFSATPSAGTLNPIVVTGNVYGNDVSKIEQWRGNLDITLTNANVAAFKPWVDYPIDLQQGVASTKSNIQFADSRLQSIVNDIKVTNLAIKTKAETEPQRIKTLSGTLAWQNLAKDESAKTAISQTAAYSFNVKNLQVSTDQGLNLQAVNASYSQTADARKTFQLKLPELKLQALTPYLLLLELPADIQTKLTAIAPVGVLNNLVLQWQGRQQETLTYLIDTRFQGLSMQAHDKVPGFMNLTGNIKANQRAGLLNLDTKNAQLEFKDILRWPVPVNKMHGQILWEIKDKATEVRLKQLAISNAHLNGMVNAIYTHDGQKGDYLDLKGKFGQGNAQYASFYYPMMLGEDTLHWLDTSILQGRAEDINLIVKGRLADFPFVDKQHRPDSKLGQFKVTAKVSNALLEYGTGWPHIEGLGLDLLFEGKRMELNAHTGHIFGNQIVKSKTTIEQLDADNPILNVVSEVKGPVAEAIHFVNNSPVREVTQGFTEDLKTSGGGKLALSLKIPMNNVESSQYKGAYTITNGTLESATIPSLNRINGTLEFTENSLSAKNIRASAFNSPLIFNVQSGKDKSIRVAARGRFNDEAIKQTLGKTAQYLSGTVEWAADIVMQKPKISIGIRSDLFGLTSSLPSPFDKDANERIGMRIDKKQDGTTDVTTVALGSRLGARVISALENNQLRMDRAVVNLNDRGPNSGFNAYNEFSNLMRSPKGLQVYGTLDYLNADSWRKVNADLKADQAAQPATSAQNRLMLGKTDLKITALDIFDRRINQLHIQNKTAQDNLQFNIQSREISGDVQWASQNNGKLIARLSNLVIPDASPRLKAAPSAITEPVKNFQKLEQDYPALDITASNFQFNKKQLGGLELVAYPQQDDWIIKKLKLTNPDSTLSAEGEWNNWTRNPNTRLTVNWDMQDLGNTLNRLGYPDVIKGGQGDLKGQLNWAGSPHEFDTLSLNGNLQFEMNKGQVLQVKPGVGRLFGLLSLQSLPRRLSLDFRDLFNSGFAFDKITATVLIDRGILRSDNFMMAGPAADVSIKGETNLRTETQQLHVKVVPNISDSVSLAALAGGPLAGAIAFLAQKVLKDPLNKIVSTEYDIVGTWDEPRETKTAEPAVNNTNSPLN